jgi:F-type H+-transporting ATPase subunit epsilon
MAQQIRLEVVTPAGQVVSEDVDIVTAPGTSGQFGVLSHHANYLTTVKTGVLSFKKDRQVKYMMVSKGFAEVSDNTVTLLVESAEYGYDIDVERAVRAKERAEQRLLKMRTQEEDLSKVRAEAALRRATARIAAAERSSKM